MNGNAISPLALRVPPATKVIRAEACGKCKFGSAISGQLYCKRSPPTVAFTMIQGRPTPVSAFPPTKPDDWCGEWKPVIVV